jgi:hypothetical protein
MPKTFMLPEAEIIRALCEMLAQREDFAPPIHFDITLIWEQDEDGDRTTSAHVRVLDEEEI